MTKYTKAVTMKMFELKDIKFKTILDIPKLSFERGKITTLLGKSGGRNVVMLSQNPIIFQGNIRNNLNIALKFQDKQEKTDSELKKILEKLELPKTLETDASELSGGEKQRLALGRILLLNADIYLFDEPSSSLDDVTEEFIIDMLVNHVKTNNKSAILVTHSKTMANKYSDVIIGIAGGNIT